MPNGTEAKPRNKWAVMGGIALNVEYTRKYAFEATAAARVTATLVAIPPPVAFQEAVQADIVGRQKRATLLVTPLPSTGGRTLPGLAPLTPPEDPLLKPGETLAVDDEQETLSLLVPEAAGVEYTLDDGVNPPSSGRVGQDGVLLHPISPQSEGAAVWFANRSAPVMFMFDRTAEDEIDDLEIDEEWLEVTELDEDELDEEDDEDEFGTDELDEDDEDEDEDEFNEDELDEDDFDEARLEDIELDEVDWEDEQTVEEIVEVSSEEETPTLSLLVPDKANQSYTLDDGINPPSEGVVDANGLLVHPISSESTGASLRFADETEAIQLQFATK